VHPLAAGRRLVLGGVEVPADFGCAGHSDADPVLHALADAVLGASALGDIGEWFPDDDAEYEGADSAELLSRVIAAAAEGGARPVNADVTVYLEKPALQPFKPAMRDRIAEILHLPPSCVGVKARTFEGLGPIGEGRAAAATAVVLMEVSGRAGQALSC